MTTPQPQAAPQKTHSKPLSQVRNVFFRDAVVDLASAFSISVGVKGIVSIRAGSLDSMGRPAVALDSGERPSDGVLVLERRTLPGGRTLVRSCLVPWSNIVNVGFEDVEEPAPTPAPAA